MNPILGLLLCASMLLASEPANIAPPNSPPSILSNMQPLTDADYDRLAQFANYVLIAGYNGQAPQEADWEMDTFTQTYAYVVADYTWLHSSMPHKMPPVFFSIVDLSANPQFSDAMEGGDRQQVRLVLFRPGMALEDGARFGGDLFDKDSILRWLYRQVLVPMISDYPDYQEAEEEQQQFKGAIESGRL